MILRTIVFIPLDLIILLEDRSLSSAYVLHIELFACSVTAARTLVFLGRSLSNLVLKTAPRHVLWTGVQRRGVQMPIIHYLLF